ncbi:MAG: hypothetical protein FJZ01_26730 [Candidatus Sericytochromatia bacterium]|nr:hypothetical protein [Candidatus Tanganyikabacteria bacterium]
MRYADDIVLGFAREDDARRVMDILPKRFERYGLTLHPEKTRMLDFRKPGRPPGPKGPDAKSGPESFDLLGFTHYWGKSLRGNWVIKRKTAKGRFSRAVRRIDQWCRANRHLPMGEQWKTLCRKSRGHNEYYGMTGNSTALVRFRKAVQRQWKFWLGRRSQKAKRSWEWFNQIKKRFPLPSPIAVHSILRHAANP